MTEQAKGACGDQQRQRPAGDEAGVSPGRERRRHRVCPSCGGSSMIRGCRVPGVQLQVVASDGERRSGLIALYSDICVDCGLTSFYARRAEVVTQLQQFGTSASPLGHTSSNGEGSSSR